MLTNKKDFIVAMVFFIMAAVLFSLIISGIIGCDDSCEPEETRCDGTDVQICGADDRWRYVMDCGSFDELVDGGWVSSSWDCCEADTGAVCREGCE
jgi:hypothetical protein